MGKRSAPTATARGMRGGTATLTIEREMPLWRDRAVAYQVILDGQQIGALHPGETRDFSIDPGEHRLRIKESWTGSPELTFTAGPGERVAFTCAIAGGLSEWRLLQSLWRRDRWVVLERDAADATSERDAAEPAPANDLAAVTPEATTLRVRRRPAPFHDRNGAYRILVDDRHVGDLTEGDTRDYVVAPGRHVLRIKTGWSGSPAVEFEAAPGETVTFECGTAPGAALVQLIRSMWRRDAWVTLEAVA